MRLFGGWSFDDLMADNRLLLGLDNPFVGSDDPFAADDELVGDDLLGGKRRRMALQLAPQPGVQEQFFPFARTSVASGATVSISGRPQRPFRTERLVIDSAIAADFTFSSLLIGVDSMFVANGDAPCGVFSEVAVGMRLRGFIATPGVDITITVTNRSSTTLTFQGGIVGTTLVAQ